MGNAILGARSPFARAQRAPPAPVCRPRRPHLDRVRRTDGSGIDEEEGVEEGYEYGGADDDESVIGGGGGGGSMGHGSVGGAILA